MDTSKSRSNLIREIKLKNRRETKKARRTWSAKYKNSINCKKPRGFSQRQHCKYGRK